VDAFVRGRRVTVAPPVLQILDRFGEPLSVERATGELAGFDPTRLRRAIQRLVRWGFLVPATDRKACRDVSVDWRGSFAAAHFHFATRNPTYLRKPGDQALYLSRRFAASPPPSPFKRYPRRPRVTLPLDGPAGDVTLEEALLCRRTVRAFSRRDVTLRDFSRIVRGTWGQTGWLDAGVLGPLVLKTSPSAGARHPVECYVLAWRVAGVSPGLYHFDVRRDGLARLRAGDFRDLAVGMAGGQAWVRGAAFLCVMTAVADRVFWKYASADAYRLFLLDAGHLAQTFVLLSAASGLGAFTTAAMSETRIERALGLDGIGEFPVYLCGAGMPRLGRKAQGSLPVHDDVQGG
jgi:SagB-type dehydrogenase family enzyme